MEFSQRMDYFKESIFTRLLEMKNKKLADGERVIDISIGTPNIPPADHIMKTLCSAVADKKNYVYAIQDQSALQKAVSSWYERRYGVYLNPETEICSLHGSQEGFANLSMTIVNEGDIVLVPDPCYPVFADGPRLAGAKLYFMPQKKEHDYLIQFSDIPKDIAQKAKLIIVSYPNNPTAAIAPDSFYTKLIAFAKENDIIVLHDNAYSELVFDGGSGKSFLSYPGAKEVGVEFNSLSKTYALAGARIGFCVGNAKVVENLKKLKSNFDYGMFIPLQEAAITAISGSQECVEETRSSYERRRNLLCDGFHAIGWKMERSKATMFVWAPIPTHYKSSEEFAVDLLDKAGVLVTPGSAFGSCGEGYVRIALVCDEEDIQYAIAQVKRSKILEG
ncbi:aminotransferase class I/II-fold pyridoxal phosphate-dependent enzyme [Konateibacter massiliensis]|uniref:aminotransferase class I/II-fold pyridoxal phosphate-dependent enzyme n=1 Tax=Konateibacter massiliensis TaxID=2002841 RepID=UPI000C14FDC3|nr:aminotransferase class I/II-fold pyridoxal phosphate-dependent enzyme [Konateibacter massiliensis]